MSTAVAKSEPRSVGNWFRRGPLGNLREEMEELVSRAFGEDVGLWPSERVCPSLDLAESDGAVEVRMDIPGMEAKDIDIQVNGNLLTISGERKEEREEKGKTYHRDRAPRGQLLPDRDAAMSGKGRLGRRPVQERNLDRETTEDRRGQVQEDYRQVVNKSMPRPGRAAGSMSAHGLATGCVVPVDTLVKENCCGHRHRKHLSTRFGFDCDPTTASPPLPTGCVSARLDR